MTNADDLCEAIDGAAEYDAAKRRYEEVLARVFRPGRIVTFQVGRMSSPSPGTVTGSSVVCGGACIGLVNNLTGKRRSVCLSDIVSILE